MAINLSDRIMRWSSHPRARLYLGAVSFAESSFFPVPPDLLLAPMVLAKRHQAWRLAAWTTLWSVLGGVAAFLVAAFAVETTAQIMREAGHWESYVLARSWFDTWGFGAVLVAGFSPIPYKVFAFAAGGMSMSLPAFVVASIAGRGGRFFLVAALVAYGGAKMSATLGRHVNRLGWASVAVAAAYVALRW